MSPTPNVLCARCGQSLSTAARFCDRCGTPVGPVPVDPLSTAPLRVGDVFDGKWRLEGKLGAGGMGAVFLARDIALDRKVAIKILAAPLCTDAEFVTRFEREARATAKLEHPNIVPVHAVGRHRGRPFIVMKALEGQTLTRLLKTREAERRPLTRAEIVPVFKQLCAGLGFIHQRGYVHRDVKSGNVFIGHDGHVTVLDFGILRDATAERITRSGQLLGTPTYASPEQIAGRDVDARADLYAVGILLFECLALRPPFEGDPVTQMRLQAEAPPPDLCALAPATPPAVRDVVNRALAKKPEHRCASAAELAAALEAAWPEVPAPRAAAPEIVETLPGSALAGVAVDATEPVGAPRMAADVLKLARSMASTQKIPVLPEDPAPRRAPSEVEIVSPVAPTDPEHAPPQGSPPSSVLIRVPKAPGAEDSDLATERFHVVPGRPELGAVAESESRATVRERAARASAPGLASPPHPPRPQSPQPMRWLWAVAGLSFIGAAVAAALWLNGMF